MKHNHDLVLLSLPPDSTMRKFLLDRAVPLPAELNWDEAETACIEVLRAVRDWPDAAKRDGLLAELSKVYALSHPAGREAAYEAAALQDVAVMVHLTSKLSDLHRAFWLYVHHPRLFDQATDLLYFDGYESRAQMHDLGIRAEPDMGNPALEAFRIEVGAFYQQKQGSGEHGVAYGMRRRSGNVLITLHLKDLPMLRLEFDGPRLKQHVGHPDFVSAIEYCPSTGVTQAIVTGGAPYQAALLKAFARHILHRDHVDPKRLVPPCLNLSSLRAGFQVPEALDDGFDLIRVRSLTLLDSQGKLKIVASAMGRENAECVTELLREDATTVQLLESGWTITAAQIDLYYPPEPGKVRRKRIKIEITSRGRLNLNQYDEALKGQLERYLVTAGVMQAGQTLVAGVAAGEDGDDNPDLAGE